MESPLRHALKRAGITREEGRENTNRLLRQYFPDGTDVSAFSQRQLDAVALRLTQRPRKTLGFTTSAAKLQQALR
ncbi:hypothetical protein SAMN05444354_106113 [Stigmatella aurantiaca]|uniref:Uncharacterized protein n=1 Tax=Stigmatella aurantiaca TaxID=41 RepID=A0A1H7QGI7_STIAU|nr:hypothetical protein SAMN05444354_106113 [Stigmatella aurantiaca]